ncbi:unnamed protein product, partial [Fusarium graminearum]
QISLEVGAKGIGQGGRHFAGPTPLLLWVPQCWLVVEALAHAPQPSRWVKLGSVPSRLSIMYRRNRAISRHQRDYQTTRHTVIQSSAQTLDSNGTTVED